MEIHVVEDETRWVVSERDVLEDDLSRSGRQWLRLGRVGDLLRLVEDLEDPLACCDRALGLADPHAEHSQGHDEHREEEVEREERTERERPGDHHAAGDEQHQCLRHEREKRQQRHVDRALPVGGERLPEDAVGGRAEAARPRLLLRERLDHVHARYRLLGDRRDVGERLLDLPQHRLRHAAVAVCRQHDERRDHERHERQLPAVEEEDDRDHDDGDDVLREEDEAVAEEEAHGLEVDRRAGHELPGLAAVVEGEREPQEVGVELVAEVVLDAERLPSRDHAPPVHERAAHEPERNDRAEQEREDPRVLVAVELVDDEAREDGDENACHLRGDREAGGDSE